MLIMAIYHFGRTQGMAETSLLEGDPEEPDAPGEGQ